MHDPPEVPDISKLPAEVRDQLAQLELELSEGDITEKGFKKKRDKLLLPFLGKKIEKNGGGGDSSPSTNAHRRRQRRLTRNESRYHSEIRQEAVLQALAQKSEKESKYVALQPMRRKKDGTSSRRPSIQKNISDSSSEDDSTLDSTRNGPTIKAKENNSINNAAKKVVVESNNNSSKPLPRPRLLRHRSHSRGDPHHNSHSSHDHQHQNQNSHQNIPTSSNGSPMQRILNDEQRLRKQNKRSSQIFGVEPPIVAAVTAVRLQHPPPDIADRALPKPPTEEDPIIEDIDEDAVYVNSGHCTSTNDSGLGSTTGVPPSSQDYANTRIPFCPGKISNNIKKMVQNLQVSLTLPLHN